VHGRRSDHAREEQIEAIVDLIDDDQAHMDMGSMADVQLEVVDDDIVVSLPEWHYSVTYYFLAAAWQLANDKARELGWIV